MQIAHKNSMVISQHKRAYFDRDGGLDKMQILHCMRKKQANPSFLPSPSQGASQPNDPKQSNFKEILKYFMWAIIILCIIQLILIIFGISLSTNDKQKLSEKDSNQFFQSSDVNSINIFKQEGKKQSSEQRKSVEEKFSAFVQQLGKLQKEEGNTKSERKIKLDELKAEKFQDNEKLWGRFLEQLAEKMQCRQEEGKIICETQLFQ